MRIWLNRTLTGVAGGLLSLRALNQIADIHTFAPAAIPAGESRSNSVCEVLVTNTH